MQTGLHVTKIPKINNLETIENTERFLMSS